MSETETMSEVSDVRDIEGFDMLNKSKQEELEAKFREQKKVSKRIISVALPLPVRSFL